MFVLGTVAAIALIVAYGNRVRAAAYSVESDFGIFLLGLKSQLAGGSFYDVTDAGRHWGSPVADNLVDLAPPHLHLLLMPLIGLPLPAAYGIWLALNTVAFLVSMVIVTRELQIVWRDVTVMWFVVAVLGAYMVSASPIITGQYVWLVMLPTTLAWRDLRRGRWTRAFGWLGLILSLKPFALAMVPYALWHRRWSALVIMGFVAGTATLVGCATFGMTSYASWLAALEYGAKQQVWMFGNLSLFGVAARLLAPSPIVEPLMDAGTPGFVVTAIVAGVVLAVSAVSVRTADTDRAWVVLWMASFLAAPLAWAYYLWWVLPPLMALARRAGWLHRAWFHLSILAFAVPPLYPNAWHLRKLTGMTTASLPCYIALLVWGVAMWPLVRAARSSVRVTRG